MPILFTRVPAVRRAGSEQPGRSIPFHAELPLCTSVSIPYFSTSIPRIPENCLEAPRLRAKQRSTMHCTEGAGGDLPQSVLSWPKLASERDGWCWHLLDESVFFTSTNELLPRKLLRSKGGVEGEESPTRLAAILPRKAFTSSERHLHARRVLPGEGWGGLALPVKKKASITG